MWALHSSDKTATFPQSSDPHDVLHTKTKSQVTVHLWKLNKTQDKCFKTNRSFEHVLRQPHYCESSVIPSTLAARNWWRSHVDGRFPRRLLDRNRCTSESIRDDLPGKHHRLFEPRMSRRARHVGCEKDVELGHFIWSSDLGILALRFVFEKFQLVLGKSGDRNSATCQWVRQPGVFLCPRAFTFQRLHETKFSSQGLLLSYFAGPIQARAHRLCEHLVGPLCESCLKLRSSWTRNLWCWTPGCLDPVLANERIGSNEGWLIRDPVSQFSY